MSNDITNPNSPSLEEQAKNIDPSIFNNNINGYNVGECDSGDYELEGILLIPNLGPAYIPAGIFNIENEYLHPQTLHVLTKQEIDINPLHRRDKYYIPVKGFTSDIIASNLIISPGCNDVSMSSLSFDIPVPIPVSVNSPTEASDNIEEQFTVHNRSAFLANLSYQIAKSSKSDTASSIDKARAAVSLLLLRNIEDENNEDSWIDKEENRIEFKDISNIAYSDSYEEAISQAKTFAGPTIIIHNKELDRFYYAPAEDLGLHIVITGNQNAPKIKVASTYYSLSDIGISAVTQDTLENIANGLRIPKSDTEYIMDNSPNQNTIPVNIISDITEVKLEIGYDQTFECQLKTMVPPMFISGDAVHDNNQFLPISNLYITPFGKFKRWKIEEGLKTINLPKLDTEEEVIEFMNFDDILNHLYVRIDETDTDFFYKEGYTSLIYAYSVYSETMKNIYNKLKSVSSVCIWDNVTDNIHSREIYRAKDNRHVFPSITKESALGQNYVHLSNFDHTNHVIANAPNPNSPGNLNSIRNRFSTSIDNPTNKTMTPSKIVRADSAVNISANGIGDATVSTGRLPVYREEAIKTDIDEDGNVSLLNFLNINIPTKDEDLVSYTYELIEIVEATIPALEKMIEKSVLSFDPDSQSIEPYLHIGSVGFINDFTPENSPDQLPKVVENLNTSITNIKSQLRDITRNGIIDKTKVSNLFLDIRNGVMASTYIMRNIISHKDGRWFFSHDYTTLYVRTLHGYIEINPAHTDLKKGLWWYNTRKTYLLIKSMASLAVRAFQQMYEALYLYSKSICFSTLTTEEEEFDIDLYYFKSGSKKIYPNIPEDIPITYIPDIPINEISRVFPEGSVFYNISMRMSTIKAEPQDSGQIVFTGIGTNKEEDADSGRKYFWSKDDENIIRKMISAEEFKDGETVISTTNALHEYYEEYLEKFGKKDMIVKDGDTISFTNKSNQSQTTSLSEMKDHISDRWWLRDTAITLDKLKAKIQARRVTGKIDAGRIFPYLADRGAPTAVSIDLSVNFQTAQPTSVSNDAQWTNENTATGMDSKYSGKLFMNAEETEELIDTTVEKIINNLTIPNKIKAVADNPDIDMEFGIYIIGSVDPSLGIGVGDSDLIKYTISELTGWSGSTDLAHATSDQWKTDGTATWYNFHLSKRRAAVLKRLIELKLNGQDTGRWVKDSEGNNIGVRFQFGETLPVGKIPIKATKIMNAAGFGSMLINSNSKVTESIPKAFEKQRSATVCVTAQVGDETRRVSLTNESSNPHLQFKISKDSESGYSISISGNSPYVPRFDTNKDWITRVSTQGEGTNVKSWLNNRLQVIDSGQPDITELNRNPAQHISIKKAIEEDLNSIIAPNFFLSHGKIEANVVDDALYMIIYKID